MVCAKCNNLDILENNTNNIFFIYICVFAFYIDYLTNIHKHYIET